MRKSFVVITDTHIRAPGKYKDDVFWNKMLFSRGTDIVEAWTAAIKKRNPDFVLHCGDLVHSGDEASIRFAKEIMDSLGCPYYIALGAHDTFYPGSRELLSSLFGFPGRKTWQIVDLGGIKLIVLDCVYHINKDGGYSEYYDDKGRARDGLRGVGVSDEEFDWLEGVVARNKDTPVIFLLHNPLALKPTYPIGRLPPEPPGKEHKDAVAFMRSFHPLRRERIRILKAISQCRKVVGIFCGHLHISDITFPKGLLHCATPSMIEYPFEMRYVLVDDAGLSITTFGLREGFFAGKSFVPQWKNRWVEGEKEDRVRHAAVFGCHAAGPVLYRHRNISAGSNRQ